MDFAFIIDPIDRLDPTHDSSIALMEAAQVLGHRVWITQAEHLEVRESKAWAALSPVSLSPVELVDGHWVAADSWFDVGEVQMRPLEEMQAVFMRTDPPVTTAYLYATFILDYVNPEKTLVVNAPAGLRHANEKMYAQQFTGAIPKTIVTANKASIREFVDEQEKAVLKPLGGMAGEGILILEKGDRNFSSLIELSTKNGQLQVMVQQFLPEAKNGDKRIIVLDGEPIGAVNRVSTGEEFRNNMAVGGRVEKVEITERERDIARQLAPKLQQDGLYFVGLDIIGNYLTEVNVTSPTGIREIDRLNDVRLGETTISWVCNRLTN
ncbi:glutathione synthase [Roseofilum casamattae]|uniref:Glutathione synthetase n=1 Tax=Roseofilum casamattae BLCC-M143 TaxID=3022442 RepID=A0ABT7BT03_9CYAN|nr:glutathione synthase [Roseofilum casamattae BLCC-M143]